MQRQHAADNLEQQLVEAIQVSLEKRPALESVIKPFAAVLLRKTAIIDDIKSLMTPSLPQIVPDRLASGIPVLADISLDLLTPPLSRALSDLLPDLKSSFPHLDADFSAIQDSLDSHIDIDLLAKACMTGDWLPFQMMAQHSGALAEVWGFAINWALSAVLNTTRIGWMTPADAACWSKGYCPFCGSLPGMAYISKPQGPADEFLPCGGGQKFLHCTLCGQDWRIERNRCPACDTNDKDHLVYYQEAGKPAERFDTCRKCGRYLLCVDLRKSGAIPSMDLAALSLVHLDILARKKGYSPMVWTPWNRVDTP